VLNIESIKQHLRGWAVKAFWAPLMFTYLCSNLPQLQWRGRVYDTYMDFHHYATNLIFSVDVCFAAIGYMFDLRLVDSQVRSTDPTTLGWVAALLCYEPFFNLLTDKYFDYHRNPPWNLWFERMGYWQDSAPFRAWGVALLLLQAAFAWCTLAFGLRYSNLSYRGVLAAGPYYFTKHPAYVTKLLSFAMLSVPWVDLRATSHSTPAVGGEYEFGAVASEEVVFEAGCGRRLRNLLCLAGLAGLYVLRARTEEAHLRAVSRGYAGYAAAISRRHSKWFGWLCFWRRHPKQS